MDCQCEKLQIIIFKKLYYEKITHNTIRYAIYCRAARQVSSPKSDLGPKVTFYPDKSDCRFSNCDPKVIFNKKSSLY